MKLEEILKNNNLWLAKQNDICLASTVKVYRNISKFSFPGRLDGQKRKQVLSLLCELIGQNSELSNPECFLGENLTPVQKELLYEHFFSPDSFHQAHSGEGFVIDDFAKFLAVINIRNHLQLQMLDTNAELEKSWNKLVRIETELGKSIDFAFSKKFGFLTADFRSCGTALAVHIYLHLPALLSLEGMGSLEEKYALNGVELGTLQGSIRDTLVGGVLTIRNSHSLGVTEEGLIHSLQATATKLVMAEKSARSQLKAEGDAVLKDRISRALGLLTHSYCLETLETLDALSLLKLGLDLSWLKGLDYPLLNQLFVSNRRGHIATRLSLKDYKSDEMARARANFCTEQLKEVKLTFN